MNQFYRKWIKMFWAVLVLNATISLAQVGFGYGHYLKHEYWLMAFSAALFCLNGWCAVNQWQQIRKIKQQQKDYMWRTLQTPSEVLR